MTPLTTRARDLAARERKLYDQTTIPAVLEELADEVEFWRKTSDSYFNQAMENGAAAQKSAAQRDEAVARAEERLRAVEAENESLRDDVHSWMTHADGLHTRLQATEAELARIRAADRTSIKVRTTEAAKMRKGEAI